MIYLDLLVGFLKVGCFAFGGAYAAIPLIRDVVLSYGWLTDEQLSYMIAVSESTPGPVMINLATYVGSSQGGVLGALLATLAVAFPAFVIIWLVLVLLRSFLEKKPVQAVLGAVKPCVIGIILATGLSMAFSSVCSREAGFAVDVKAAIVAGIVAAAVIVWRILKKKKASPIALIIVSACLGMLVYGI
ncbi:MAG: chromate transporter [Oscillospiraceae bacterium]|nr:chromate transporter [Oscillospiraceae bacterium]